jgi:hypothetical protein
MSHAQLRAKKDEIEGDQSPDSHPSSNQAHTELHPTANNPSPVLLPVSNQPPSIHTTLPGLGQGTLQPWRDSHDPPHLPKQAMHANTTPDPADSAQVLSQQHNVYSETLQIRPDTQKLANNRITTLNPSAPVFFSTAQRDLEENTQKNPSRADTDVHTALEIAKADVNPAGNQEAQQPVTAASPSEEGEEVDMSVSEGDEDEEEDEYEPEYEPEEPMVVAEISLQNEVEVQTKPEFSLASSQASPQEEEAYEPPDIEEDIPDVQASDEATANQNVPTIQAEAEDGAMDIATSSDDSSDDSESDDDSTPEPEMGKSISAYNPLHQDAGIADDLAPELQPEVTSTAAAGGPVRQPPCGRPS